MTMCMQRFFQCLIVLIFCVMLSLAEGKSAINVKFEKEDILKQVGELKGEEIEGYCERYREDRADAEMFLVKQLKSAKSNQEKCTFAYLLGLYRMENSVQALAESITLKSDIPMRAWDGDEPLIHQYPARDALIKIGKPSTPQMIKNIERSDDEKVRELSVSVIRHVEGVDAGRFVIEKAILKQKDNKKKQRLQEALSSKYFLASTETSKADISIRKENTVDAYTRKAYSKLKELNTLGEKLLAIFCDANQTAEVRLKCAEALTAMKYSDAIPKLIEFIDLEPEGQVVSEAAISLQYVCVQYLSDFGVEAVPAIVDEYLALDLKQKNETKPLLLLMSLAKSKNQKIAVRYARGLAIEKKDEMVNKKVKELAAWMKVK